MADSNFLDFTPVPLRARRGGWTAERQRAFIADLAAGLRPGAAAARLGLSRQSAYLLRDHRHGAGFAAAWDGALATAQALKAARRAPGEYERAVVGVLHPVRYRGRIAAWDRRFSDSALRRLLGRLDAHLEKHGMSGAAYFALGMSELCQEPRPPARPEPSPSRASRCGTGGIRRWQDAPR